MKTFLSFVLLLLAAVVQAISSTGSRLLVVLNDPADKDKYSTFFGDLTGMILETTAARPQLHTDKLTRARLRPCFRDAQERVGLSLPSWREVVRPCPSPPHQD